MSAARHGTTAGWQVHKRAGERPCDPCYRAKAEYDRRWRAVPARVRESRTLAVAQRRAYQALAHRYPDEYRAEYERAKAELAAEDSEGGDRRARVGVEVTPTQPQ